MQVVSPPRVGWDINARSAFDLGAVDAITAVLGSYGSDPEIFRFGPLSRSPCTCGVVFTVVLWCWRASPVALPPPPSQLLHKLAGCHGIVSAIRREDGGHGRCRRDSQGLPRLLGRGRQGRGAVACRSCRCVAATCTHCVSVCGPLCFCVLCLSLLLLSPCPSVSLWFSPSLLSLCRSVPLSLGLCVSVPVSGSGACVCIRCACACACRPRRRRRQSPAPLRGC